MKKINSYLAIALCAAVLTVQSCDNSNDGGDEVTLSVDEQGFVDSYVDDIVVTRYAELATNAKLMLEAAEAIEASTAADKTTLIATAAAAWEASRISWERTEAYLFGPVDVAGIDPGIDSWPLVLDDLKVKIQGWDDSNNDLAADGGDLKGFHAIEYVLFADGSAKPTTVTYFGTNPLYAISQGSLSDEAFEDNLESYLVAVCTELYRCVLQLEAEWDYDSLSSSKLSDFNNFGSAITLTTTAGQYGSLFKNPGLDNAYYSSFNACVSEALLGAIGIADEVANVKISDPIDAEIESTGTGLLEVESWFSHNSISDFTNNVRGIKEAYMGKLCTTASSFDVDTTPATYSLGYRLALIDSSAASEVVTALNDAIAAVAAMPAPFRDNLSWSSENLAAKEAVSAVQEALESAYVTLLNESVPEGEDE